MTGYQMSELSDRVESIHLYYTGKRAPKCVLNFRKTKNDTASADHHLETKIQKKLIIDLPHEIVLRAIVDNISSGVDRHIADCLDPTKGVE